MEQASQGVKATRATVALVWWRGIELTLLCRDDLRGGESIYLNIKYIKSECNGSMNGYTVKSIIPKMTSFFVGWRCKPGGGNTKHVVNTVYVNNKNKVIIIINFGTLRYLSIFSPS